MLLCQRLLQPLPLMLLLSPTMPWLLHSLRLSRSLLVMHLLPPRLPRQHLWLLSSLLRLPRPLPPTTKCKLIHVL